VKETNDLDGITLKAGVPEKLAGCHTMFVDGYVVVGHVTVEIMSKLLNERPPIAGIAIPGMPTGVPGMDGPKTSPVQVYEVSKNKTEKAPTVYAVE
jgi:hypothetical protein